MLSLLEEHTLKHPHYKMKVSNLFVPITIVTSAHAIWSRFKIFQSVQLKYKIENSVLTGIEEVFLNSAIGMIKLSEDSQCTSLRVYDSSDTSSPTAILQPPPPLTSAVQLDKGPSPGEQERVLACC